MPGFNGTGPQGLGPMTGGARGYCLDPAQAGPAVGFGYGRGRRAGRGFGRGMGMRQGFGAGWGVNPAAAPQGAYDQRSALEYQVKILEDQLSGMKETLSSYQRNASGGSEPSGE